MSKAQIVATIGGISEQPKTLKAMLEHNVDAIRLNFSYGNFKARSEQIKLIRQLEAEYDRKIPIIIDLPGPRVQEMQGHTYDKGIVSALTPRDEQIIKFSAEHDIDYIAVSFVGGPQDVEKAKRVVAEAGGKQRIIAKIERAVALRSLDSIIAKADGVMVARGDLGNEVPLEQIPFIQEKIIQKAKKAGKLVIVATQMLFSMVESPTPTRAEVTDVATAIIQGSDAVMLSDETAKGKYPVESVAMMKKIILEAEKNLPQSRFIQI
jgi:pyruvate kinase